MKIASRVVTGLIASLVFTVAFAFAEQSGSQQTQQSDPGMQQSSQSGSQSQQGSMMQNPDTIKQVQQALSSQGYDAGPADGKIGSKTKSALKKFQKSQGMQASGKLDQQTLAALGVSEGSAAGGQESEMQKEQSGSGAGGSEAEKQDQQSGTGAGSDKQDQMSGSGAGGSSQSSDQQTGGKY